MNDLLHVTTFTGPFGFIKPWTAVRDGETFSQQFLTPSIVEGMRIKLDVNAILRHRLSHQGFDVQMERIQSAGWSKNKKSQSMTRNTSILDRGTLLKPCLHLAFESETDAQKASEQHICLCRNEDILYPHAPVALTLSQFDAIDGFELLFGAHHDGAFLVGYNRFDEGRPMYGALSVTGHPTYIPEPTR